MARNRIHRIDRLSEACVQCGATMDDMIDGRWPRRCPTDAENNILTVTHHIYRRWLARAFSEEQGPLSQKFHEKLKVARRGGLANDG